IKSNHPGEVLSVYLTVTVPSSQPDRISPHQAMLPLRTRNVPLSARSARYSSTRPGMTARRSKRPTQRSRKRVRDGTNVIVTQERVRPTPQPVTTGFDPPPPRRPQQVPQSATDNRNWMDYAAAQERQRELSAAVAANSTARSGRAETRSGTITLIRTNK